MKAALLISVLASLALADGGTPVSGRGSNVPGDVAPPGHHTGPCQRYSDNKTYNVFVRRHIIAQNETFDRLSTKAWRSYLVRSGFCDRPRQSFIEQCDEERVKRICGRGGYWLRGNLCISCSRIRVYDLRVNVGKCDVCLLNRDKNRERYVIVSCDKVGNQCLPVNYAESRDQRPGGTCRVCYPYL